MKAELKNILVNGTVQNDNSLAAQVHENITWAWDNWDEKVLSTYYEGEKPETYTEEFMNDWIDNEDS